MKKIVSILISFLMVVSYLVIPVNVAGAAENSIKQVLPNAYGVFTKDGSEYSLAVSDFGTMADPGNPDLPYKEFFIALPPNVVDSSVKVTIVNGRQNNISVAYPIKPAGPAVAYVDNQRIEDWGRGKNIKDGKNIDVYENDAFFPESHVSLVNIGKMRKWKIASVVYYPYLYNPVKKRLEHSLGGSISISYDTVVVASSSTRMMSSRRKTNQAFKNRFKSLVSNSGTALDWYGDSDESVTAASATRMAAAVEEKTQYLIITTNDIVNSSTKLSAFVQHKEGRGFSVKVITEDDFGGGTGDSAAENIRNYLKSHYESDNIEYVLLIGNPHPETGAVPMKMLWPRSNATAWTQYREAPSDYYYAELNSNWDSDNDGLFGEFSGIDGDYDEIDGFSEVMVGRIPYYGVIDDLDSILIKTINYENGVYAGDWTKRVLLSMGPGDGDGTRYLLGEEIIYDVLNPVGFSGIRVYDEDFGLSPSPEYTPCNYDNVLNAWQQHVGFHVWWTHGMASYAACVFKRGDCDQLDDDYPSFVFQASCNTGYPEKTYNLGYSLLKQGAIATCSASRVSWDDQFAQTFSDSLTISGMGRNYIFKILKNNLSIANALNEIRTRRIIYSSADAMWMNLCVFNIYGDPSLKYCTGEQTKEKPVAVISADKTIGKAPLSVSFNARRSTSNGSLTYLWDFDDSSFSNSAVASHVFTSTGVYDVSLKVTDSRGESDLKTIKINVVAEEDTIAPTVKIISPLEGESCSPDGFIVRGIAKDASGIESVKINVKDYSKLTYTVSSREVTMSDDGESWSFSVLPRHITKDVNAYVMVIATDKSGNKSFYDTVTIEVKDDDITEVKDDDKTLPALEITSPAQDEKCLPDGFIFKGIAKDESGIESVKIHVKDYARNMYTASNKDATISADGETWSFSVLPEHITEGAKVGLYAIATDKSGNKSCYESITVEAKNNDKTAPVVKITSPINGSEVSLSEIVFEGTVEDDSEIEAVTVYVRDCEKNIWAVRDKQATYNSATKKWQFNLNHSYVRIGGKVKFFARAKDVYGNLCAWQTVEISVKADKEAVDKTAPEIVITTPKNNQSVSSGGFIFKGTATDESTVSEVRIYVDDKSKAGISVNNQLAKYDKTTKEWSFTVTKKQMTEGEKLLLLIRAKDTKGNWSGWKSSLVTVEKKETEIDKVPPVILIEAPKTNEQISGNYIFKGTATDDSDVSEVRIYVFDYGQNRYEVKNQQATYNAITKQWTYSIKTSDLTQGSKVKLWVRAKDSQNNWSSWKNVIATIENKSVVNSNMTPDDNSKVAQTKDKTAPKITITGNTSKTSGGGINLSGTATDAESKIKTVKAKLYYGNNTACSRYYKTYTASLSGNSWQINVSATDLKRIAARYGSSQKVYIKGKLTATNAVGLSSGINSLPIIIQDAVIATNTTDNSKVAQTKDKTAPKITITGNTSKTSGGGINLSGTATDAESKIKTVKAKLYYGNNTACSRYYKTYTASLSGNSWQINVSATDLKRIAARYGSSQKVYIKGKLTATNAVGLSSGINSSAIIIQDAVIASSAIKDTTAPQITINNNYKKVKSGAIYLNGTATDAESKIKTVKAKLYYGNNTACSRYYKTYTARLNGNKWQIYISTTDFRRMALRSRSAKLYIKPKITAMNVAGLSNTKNGSAIANK